MAVNSENCSRYESNKPRNVLLNLHVDDVILGCRTSKLQADAAYIIFLYARIVKVGAMISTV